MVRNANVGIADTCSDDQPRWRSYLASWMEGKGCSLWTGVSRQGSRRVCAALEGGFYLTKWFGRVYLNVVRRVEDLPAV